MSPTIYVLAEGNTEKAFREKLKLFIDERAGDKPKVKLAIRPVDGTVCEKEIQSRVPAYLNDKECLGVVALIDVYPDFKNAEDAKEKLNSWLPKSERCYAHVALHDFEAWLLTNWDNILQMAKVRNKKPWGTNPETINLTNPPSIRMEQFFSHEANPKQKYSKIKQGKLLMKKLDLLDAASKCPELKKFLNTLLRLAGYQTIS